MLTKLATSSSVAESMSVPKCNNGSVTAVSANVPLTSPASATVVVVKESR